MKKRFDLKLFTLFLSGVLTGCADSNSSHSSNIENKLLKGCRGGYPVQTESHYVLPYPVGFSFIVGQGNCTDGSHSEDQKYAYDFDMLVGTTVISSRGGVVIAVEESFIDGNRTAGEENFVLIQHSDNSISGYYHLTHDGVHVEVGSHVSQGDIIGLSGDTGDSTEPHLHFEVLKCQDCVTLPVNFRNTRRHTDGLDDGASYEALAF